MRVGTSDSVVISKHLENIVWEKTENSYSLKENARIYATSWKIFYSSSWGEYLKSIKCIYIFSLSSEQQNS